VEGGSFVSIAAGLVFVYPSHSVLSLSPVEVDLVFWVSELWKLFDDVVDHGLVEEHLFDA